MSEAGKGKRTTPPGALCDGLAALRAVRRVAAPSWVVPAPLAENCRFLAGKVDEAGLLFFDATTCLAYDGNDLPPDLARLPLTYHVHLPLDLPWHDPAGAATICRALMERCAFLPATPERGAPSGREREAGPEREVRGKPGIRAVLHPPDCAPQGDRNNAGQDARRLIADFLERFAALGGDPSLLLLENTPENDLAALEESIVEAGLGICLDLGHLLACGQERLLSRTRLLDRTRLLHLSAPGRDGGRIRHLPLTALDGAGRAVGRRLCRDTPEDAVVMVELFSWSGIEESLPVLCSWLLPGR